ncbi:MAG: SpoIIE family protein phosphatase [Bacteroidales bacterium]|nr:SpoIIE family protein phosphatase [Bacteroidales bacterium]
MDLKKYLSVLLILILSGYAYGQVESKGIPYIKNYTRAEYDGNPQIFNIIQDNRGVMYFANQTYILEFDGKTWHKIFLPNDPTVYSLAKNDAGRIFVGASANEMGYLKVGDDGDMIYKSLTEKIPEDKKQFTRVTQVHKTKKNHIVFVTPLTIYIYENDTIKTIDISKPENSFFNSFKINDRIFIYEKGRGILEFTNDELKLLDGTSEFYSQKQPYGMYPGPKGSVYITSWQDSVRLLSGGKLESLEKNSLFYSLIYPSVYDNNYFLGGLYGQGMVITDKNLNVIKHLSSDNGLQNNTVWCVYADMNKNIWVGTNDGISVIYANLPNVAFSERSNLTEAGYASVKYDNNIYIGTSAGVFYKDFSKSNTIHGEKFKLVENEMGLTQIWKIDILNKTLLFAGQSGLFQITGNKANLIGPNVSVKNFIGLKNHPDKILATGGNGLSLFKFKNGKWEFAHKLNNFKGFYVYIQEDNNGHIWVSDRSKGIFRLKLNTKLDSVIEEKTFTTDDGLPDIYGNYVFKINDKIIFTTKKGVYSFDNESNKFIKNQEFYNIFNKDIIIDKIYQARNGNIWFKEVIEDPKIKNKQSWELGLIKKTADGYQVIKTPYYKVKNNIYSINQISDNELVVGNENGFVLYNLDSKKQFDKPFNALIRKVEFIKNDSLLFGGTFSDANNNIVLVQEAKQIPKIPYEFNDLRFFFSSIFYEEPEKTQYMFKLQGNDADWSDWKSITNKEYSNLDPGTYTFIVKAKNLYNIESEVAEYTFEILPPWYRTLWAYVGYFILFILFIYGVIQLSVFRLKKQRENLKRIVEERTQEIQIQKEEIEAKNETLSEQNEEIIQKNNSITASINYAKRIQEAMLPLREKITAGLEENFILFKPRDIVSGDFYWYAERNNKIIYTAVDCTGHGVPGALMSMIGSEILTTIVNKNITKADEILEKMNESVIKVLKQDTEGFSQDGMDMALCVIDKENKTIEFAGAKNPLIYITNGKLIQVKANRSGIGGYQQEKKDFSSHIIQYESPTWFYMFTDGFQDQFGGPNDRKYMIKRLKELLLDIHYKPMQEQHDILKKEIEDWMIDSHQTDDILLACIKL